MSINFCERQKKTPTKQQQTKQPPPPLKKKPPNNQNQDKKPFEMSTYRETSTGKQQEDKLLNS